MARIKGPLEGAQGDLSGLVFYQRGDKTIVYAKPEQRNSKTPRQMQNRIRWSNIINTYRAFDGKLFGAFENKEKGKNDYNRFIALNLDCPIYIPQKQFDVISIAAPYQITEGSLPPIEVEDLGNQCLRSSLQIGDLEIDGDTTLGQLSEAIIKNNRGIDYGDRILFFEVIQREEGQIRVIVSTQGFKVGEMKDVRVQDLLKAGFENVDRCLGARNLPKGCYTWVHIRKESPSLPAKVSTQRLTNLNKELVETYSSAEAFVTAAQSYGCKNATVTNVKTQKTPRSPFE